MTFGHSKWIYQYEVEQAYVVNSNRILRNPWWADLIIYVVLFVLGRYSQTEELTPTASEIARARLGDNLYALRDGEIVKL